MNNELREEILEAYSEKVAAEIASMSEEEVDAKLAEFEEGEDIAKLAADEEALGRVQFLGIQGAYGDFEEAIKVADGDKAVAIGLMEEDLVKHAGEIQARAEELLEDAGSEVETAEKVAYEAALSADPEAVKQAMAQVLADNEIAVYELDEAGEPIAEMLLV